MWLYAPTIDGYAYDGGIVCADCFDKLAAAYREIGNEPPEATPILSSESHGSCTADTGCLDQCDECGQFLGQVECYSTGPDYGGENGEADPDQGTAEATARRTYLAGVPRPRDPSR